MLPRVNASLNGEGVNSAGVTENERTPRAARRSCIVSPSNSVSGASSSPLRPLSPARELRSGAIISPTAGSYWNHS